MKHRLFFRWGCFVHHYRWSIILAWLAIVCLCIPFLPHILTPFKSTGFIDEHSGSVQAQEWIDQRLGYNHLNRFMILYHSDHLRADHALFLKKIKDSLHSLQHFPIKHEIVYPDADKKQISKDKHTAYVVVIFKDSQPLSDTQLQQFQETIKKPSHMTMHIGGEAVFTEGLSRQTQEDLYQADMVAAPISIIVLLIVFGSIVATLVPICLGGGCAVIILTALYFICHFVSLSVFTINIALLLGLCLSLDYALFIIYRFRSELKNGYEVEDAIAITLTTAGRAVFYSGLAVLISLSALLLFPINVLFSIGVGGLTAVVVAVCIAISLLPAILSVLGGHINRFSIRSCHVGDEKPGFWGKTARAVTKRPVWFFLASLIVLILCGVPFLNVKFGLSDFHIFPESSPSRVFFDEYKNHFNENTLNPIQMIVTTKDKKILSKANIGRLYRLVAHLQENPLVAEVDSIVSTKPHLTKKQYQQLYTSPARYKDKDVKQLLKLTTHKNMTVVNIVSKYDANAAETKQLITALRAEKVPHFSLRLAGSPVENEDLFASIKSIFPYAIAWIAVLTYCILLFLLRSLILPLKAIFMNILSLCATYGILVFIFQEGYLHQWLNFEPQGILDISLLIIIFCALFGFSMDYEVFLLTRIQECYRKTKNNQLSIIFGIEQSSRIITSAALIVICLCGSFMVADVLMVKEFGLGIAVAIFVDAFIIRCILVPATMVLIKEWNWYLPRWLNKILPRH